MARPTKLTIEQENIIYNQRKLGKPIALIAYSFNVSVRTVDRILKKIKDQEASNNEK